MIDIELPRIDRTALSFWFPFIKAAGLPVPRTKIFAMPQEAQDVIWAGMDGRDGGDALANFAIHVTESVFDLGFPLFLRTDHTSAKHDWDRACYVATHEEMASHMFAIAEFSEIAGMFGDLPWDTWVAREMLPTIPFGVCPAYRNMPICREFRVFVDGGEVVCTHPYWPRKAIARGGATVSAHDFKKLSTLRDTGELQTVTDLARHAGAAVGGAWSVDILETSRGWYVTDMAEAHKSFHWPDCPHEARCRKVPS